MALYTILSGPMLTRMLDERIFAIEVLEGKEGFCIYEACDECYGTWISREELIQLGQELIDKADTTFKHTA
jgi:hypothetical protein